MDDLIAEFIMETNESLNELDQDMVSLEQNPNDKDLLGKIFRVMHTVKGTCGFLGLPRLEGVAHHAEDVLGLFRDGKLEVTEEYVTLIFESLDRIKYIVGEIEATGQEPEGDDSELKEKLKHVYAVGSGEADAEPEQAAAEPEPAAVAEEVISSEGAGGSATEEELEAAFRNAEVLPPDQLDPPKMPEPKKDAASAEKADDEAKDKQESQNSGTQQDKAAKETNDKDKPKAEQQKVRESNLASQSLRVSVDVLENLMTVVSELVLTRNQLLQIARTQKDSEFNAPLQRLNHVVSELQEGVMKTRMQPIGNAWNKLPRIIRDISLELDKKIDLEMHGQDTELDRQVLDLIKDPLTHMVRNSADHGIESPEDRTMLGKPETGKIILNAYHEGGHIIIEISDDGKGLATDKIKAKAIASGLATEEELESMSTQQIQQLIFKAGLSTAEQVTAVSGRGVGMDVVKSNIEKIGGSVELDSEEGKGSTFTIKIPLTLAIVSAMIVESAGERFAIPQLAVRELVMTSLDGDNKIETIKGTPVFRLRDHLLPLVALDELLQIKRQDARQDIPANDLPLTDRKLERHVAEATANLSETNKETEEKDTETAKTGGHHPEDAQNAAAEQTNVVHLDQRKEEEKMFDNKYIVVTQVGAYHFGIIVDRVFDMEEIVVKPVANILRNIEMFSGNTILGDGSVIMILDPAGIAKSSGEVNAAEKARQDEKQERASTEKEKTSLLLFTAGDAAPKTVPLELVSRLEEIKTEDIEYSDGKMVVQYRGHLMPLTAFNSSVKIDGKESKPVLVFADEHKAMGLIVDEIVDITEEYIDVQVGDSKGSIIGSAIINDKATDVIDVGYFLEQTHGNWFKNHGDEAFEEMQTAESKDGIKRVLLVEDSPFFRNMLTPLLKMAGYQVTASGSPKEALKMCEDGREFDIIVSDIEMPEMSGFEFAEKVKGDSNWADTPMVALSSHATPQDMDRGLEAGFSRYIAKFDRDTLLNTLSQTIAERGEAS